MLLPSAFPFDALHQPSRLTSTFTPPPPVPSPSSPSNLAALSSCRALQAILGSRPPSPFQPARSNYPRQRRNEWAINVQNQNEHQLRSKHGKGLLPSTRVEQQQKRSPLRLLTPNSQIPVSERPGKLLRGREQRLIIPPKNPKKRSRTTFESSDEDNLTKTSLKAAEEDQRQAHHITYPHNPSIATASTYDPTNSTPTPTYPPNPPNDQPSTPKRPRLQIPLLMPLGLCANDFKALHFQPKHHHLHLPTLTPTLSSQTTESDSDSESESAWYTPPTTHNHMSTQLERLDLSCHPHPHCPRHRTTIKQVLA